MVLNAGAMVAVASLSADLCQHVACNPQRLPTHEVLELLCCLPLHHLGRVVVCVCSFFCLPSPDLHPTRYARFRRSFSSSSSSSSSGEEEEYGSHSD